MTLDAIGCQKAMARQLRDQGADYVLAVKDNQENLHRTLQSSLGRGHSNLQRSKLTTREKKHGRTEQRT